MTAEREAVMIRPHHRGSKLPLSRQPLLPLRRQQYVSRSPWRISGRRPRRTESGLATLA